MLSLTKIQQAHQRYTGADFPKLFKAFKDMGIIMNTVNIQQGITVYIHEDGSEISDKGIKVTTPIAQTANLSLVKDILQRHQAGETSFPIFCNEIAQAGVYKWDIDIHAGTCTYMDMNNQVVIAENIPQ
ncbi:DUF1398 domain-containing protein [Staphylococcus edaphicus]|uniref:DUF1398 family protein n=1 Tax=Staphylococcus edaphicus TaxID=1955013 RepID=A0A2C6WQ95_9STAP|nr:DUF1398 family protein [Staphylococcus edaphicus]PHK49964.1 hypothetical protein BTJ66_05515 [Staphylococcus edaphicus]UQW81775.1 DUF1398 family protein [Staphylococcus edaphicus]